VAPAVLSRNVFKPGQGPLDIGFKALKAGTVTVRVYALSGARVRSLASTVVAGATWSQVPWDGRDDQGKPVASGLYVVSVQGAGIQRLLKVDLLR
jgi:flagellar hook assembly protein FlgD